jgi:sugar lactone lactonase YvrE
MLYGPLVFGGRVVRVDPDSGEMTTVSDDFRMPGALKLHNGEAYVLEDGSELKRVNLETGQTTTFATLPSGADNLAFNSAGRLFVTLSGVNAIVEVDIETGNSVYIVEPSTFNSVTGLAVITGSEGDRIYLGDLFGGVRIVNAGTGSIEETPVDIFQPAHISVTDDHLVVVSEVFGDIQLLDRSDFSLIRVWHDFNSPGDALEAPNGDIIVAETGSGRLLRVTGPEPTDRQVVADGLDDPTGLAWAGDNEVFVTETGGGRLLRIDLASGAVKPVATDLAQPEGVAVGPDDHPLVVEVASRRLTRIDSVDGSKIVIADELPVGLSNGPSLYRGVAVSPSAIYINSDIDNTLYRLTQL